MIQSQLFPSRSWRIASLLIVVLAIVTAILLSSRCWSNLVVTTTWALGQWLPLSRLRDYTEQWAWQCWEHEHVTANKHVLPTAGSSSEAPITIISVPEYRQDPGALFRYLKKNHPHWRKRPLLLRNLLLSSPTDSTTTRQHLNNLSLTSLLRENLSVPYYTDSTKPLLRPDAMGRLGDILRNMTHGAPHKLGTQLLLQQHPEYIRAVPVPFVTALFGDYFQPQHLQSAWGGIVPPLTTAVFFAANNNATSSTPVPAKQRSSETSETIANADVTNRQSRPFTGLHSEPINNLAVQLTGQKEWTLVGPHYSRWLSPGLSRDGRAFLASYRAVPSPVELHEFLHQRGVPFHSVVTRAGDALWIPTWTWHRVDYQSSTTMSSSNNENDYYSMHDNDNNNAALNTMSLGISIFHFDFKDFVQNNPLFAFLIQPALVKELLGFKIQ